MLSAEYDLTKLKDELQLCALILSYSPKNESTWSHRYTPSCTCEASFLVDFFLSDNGYLFGADFDNETKLHKILNNCLPQEMGDKTSC